jgi:hypothetical protein
MRGRDGTKRVPRDMVKLVTILEWSMYVLLLVLIIEHYGTINSVYQTQLSSIATGGEREREKRGEREREKLTKWSRLSSRHGQREKGNRPQERARGETRMQRAVEELAQELRKRYT